MKYKGSEILVGSFVLAGLVVIIVGIFTIRGLGYGRMDDYSARYTNAGGIEVGTAVKFNGVLRGRVKDIVVDAADPTHVKVLFAVKTGTPVTTRTIAKITRADILGDPYIDLRFSDTRQGTAEDLVTQGEQLEPGSEVTAGDAFDFQATLDNAQAAIESLSDLAALLKDQLQDTIKAISRLLASAENVLSDDNRARIEATLANLEAATGAVDDLLGENRSHLDAIMGNADRATANLVGVSGRLDATLDELVPRLSTLLDQSRQSLDDVRKLLGTADGTLRSLDTRAIADLLGNLDTASRNLSELSRDLKDHPYRIVRPEKPGPGRFGETPPKAKDEASASPQ